MTTLGWTNFMNLLKTLPETLTPQVFQAIHPVFMVNYK
jgi:hypothetical protein